MSTEVERYKDDGAKSVAQLVAEGAKLVKSYETLHGKATNLARDITFVVVRLRAKHEDKNGRPDLRGRSQEYRDAVRKIYEKAGIPSDAEHNLQGLVRYHVSTTLREYMKANGYTSADFQYYKLKEETQKDVARDRMRDKAASAGMIAVDPDDLPGTASRVLERAEQGLAILTESAEMLHSLSALQGETRDDFMDRLDRLDEGLAKVRASL